MAQRRFSNKLTPQVGNAANQIAKYPAWTTLPEVPLSYIHADHRIETDIDVNGVGRIRVKPGYNVSGLDEIRYGCL